MKTFNLLRAVAVSMFLLPTLVFAASTGQCLIQNNSTPAKLAGCINTPDLMANLTVFQLISDLNGGNRDTGLPGYKASVNYAVTLLKLAGYKVTIQQVPIAASNNPYFYEFAPTVVSEVSPEKASFPKESFETMVWFTPSFVTNGSYPANIPVKGSFKGQLQPVGNILLPAPAVSADTSGCSSADFAHFVPGNVALIERGSCTYITKVVNAINAGASAVLVFNDGAVQDPATINVANVLYEGVNSRTDAILGTILPSNNVTIPAIFLSYQEGVNLYNQTLSGKVIVSGNEDIGNNPAATSYNVIADSQSGDPNNVLIVDGHLDSIYGAGIDDNATGSAALLDIAVMMAHTHPLNHVRFVLFGAEEIGLFGSQYYLSQLSPADLSKIKADVDLDTIGTINYVYGVYDPADEAAFFGGAANVGWDPAATANSTFITNQFINYFTSNGLPYVTAGTDMLGSPITSDIGSDSGSFLTYGIPAGGLEAGEFYGKSLQEVALFGGTVGDYEQCGDQQDKHCDNVSNVSPSVFTVMSKAAAYVISELSNMPGL